MRKRILSLLCVLALCLGLLPVTALAEGTAPDNLYVGDQVPPVGRDSYWTTSTDGKLITCEATNDWNVAYDAGSTTLTLKNATIEGVLNDVNTAGTGIYAASSSGAVSLNIVLEGENRVSGGHGINVSSGKAASLSISGSGSLTVSATAINGVGILVQAQSDANLTINGANVNAVVTETNGRGVELSTGHAGNPNLTIEVQGGSLQASGQPNGIKFFTSANDTRANANLKVSGNAMVKTSGITTDADGSGVQLPDLTTEAGTGKTGGIVFDGSAGSVYGTVELQNDVTISEGETLTIGDGASLTVPSGKTLTNNGTVTTTGSGTLTNSGTINNSGTLTDSIEGSQPPKITTASLPNGEVDKNYSQPLAVDNNPTSWSVTNGTLPNGLTLENGTISGIPTAAGTSTFTVKAENTAGSDSKELTLTINPAPVLVTSVALNKSELSLYTGQSEILTATVQPEDAANQNVTWQSGNANVATVEGGTVTAVGAGEATITVTTEDGSFTATCTITVEKPYTPPPYIPPTKTPSQQAIDKIEDAKEGSTVKITLRTGQTKLDKEVFEELAGRDVTLEISLPGGVTWTVNGQDIPENADLTDLDLGVTLDASTIPVSVVNTITGAVDTIQISLKHDGEFGFTMTLSAPLGVENKGLWANLYHYNTTKKQMLFETAAQVDASGNVALKFSHASEYAIVLDEKSHELPFTDTVKGAWYQGAVEYVYRNGIMTGTSATTFEPGTTLSRAMVAQILYNLEGQPDISEENLGYPYSDVDAEAWYGDAVYWTRINGVATGYEDNTFRPNKAVTREELAQMLYNYAKVKDYDLTASSDLTAFPDGDKVSDWAETAMAWANGNQLINGFEDDTLRPGGDSTRAQAASILMNFDVNLAN